VGKALVAGTGKLSQTHKFRWGATIWRAIEAGLFTFTELETTASYPDFVQATRHLDITQRIEANEYERIRKEARR